MNDTPAGIGKDLLNVDQAALFAVAREVAIVLRQARSGDPWFTRVGLDREAEAAWFEAAAREGDAVYARASQRRANDRGQRALRQEVATAARAGLVDLRAVVALHARRGEPGAEALADALRTATRSPNTLRKLREALDAARHALDRAGPGWDAERAALDRHLQAMRQEDDTVRATTDRADDARRAATRLADEVRARLRMLRATWAVAAELADHPEFPHLALREAQWTLAGRYGGRRKPREAGSEETAGVDPAPVGVDSSPTRVDSAPA